MNIQKINVQQPVNRSTSQSFGVKIKPINENVLDDFLDSLSTFSQNPLNKEHQGYIKGAKRFFDNALQNLVCHNETPANHVMDGGKIVFINEIKLTAGALEKKNNVNQDFLVATSNTKEATSTIPNGTTPSHSILEITTKDGDIYQFDKNTDIAETIQQKVIARIKKTKQSEVRQRLIVQLNS